MIRWLTYSRNIVSYDRNYKSTNQEIENCCESRRVQDNLMHPISMVVIVETQTLIMSVRPVFLERKENAEKNYYISWPFLKLPIVFRSLRSSYRTLNP